MARWPGDSMTQLLRDWHAYPNVPLPFSYFKRPQILFCRAFRDFSAAEVETGAVPGTLDLGVANGAFGEWAEAVGAKFLDGIECAIDAGDQHHRRGDFHAECRFVPQSAGSADRDPAV